MYNLSFLRGSNFEQFRTTSSPVDETIEGRRSLRSHLTQRGSSYKSMAVVAWLVELPFWCLRS